MGFCESIGVERKDALRYRLSAEECLLYWLEHGLEGSEVSLQMGTLMRSPFITLEVQGKSLNPYAEDDDDYGTYTDSILVSLGLSPEYSYARGRNRIRFRIKKKSLNQVVVLCIVLGTAALFGVLGMLLIPADVRGVLLKSIVKPLYDTFFKILGCLAGPMVFLSVVEGVNGIGNAETFGRIGRGLMIRFALIVLISSAAASVFFPILGPEISGAGEGGSHVGTITDLLLGIFPSNIVEPFTSGNTLQVILMGIVIGIALLYLGRQTSSLADTLNQINALVQFLMQLISKIMPYVIFLVVVNLTWSGGLSILLTSWKLFAVMLLAIVLMSVVFLAVTSVKMKVRPILLIKKSLPTFLIALTTASSAAAFSSNVETCENKFGIEPSFIRFGIPLGMVIHKPVTGVYNLLLVFYFARQYNVRCSFSWICIAVFICAIVAIAMPPIPGGGAVGYSLLFLQMGIPSDALAVALAMDIITDFFITAFETFILPLSFINISSKMGMIEPEVLRKTL
jgi:Na+/H+-dicarboxylate symporter